jgi:hypothetical protein
MRGIRRSGQSIPVGIFKVFVKRLQVTGISVGLYGSIASHKHNMVFPNFSHDIGGNLFSYRPLVTPLN